MSNAESTVEGFDLGKNKRVSVSQFKGHTLVNIREYYEANGKTLPGKKGIALSLESWKKLVEYLPQIEKEIRKAEGVIDEEDEEDKDEKDSEDEEDEEDPEDEEDQDLKDAKDQDASSPKRVKLND